MDQNQGEIKDDIPVLQQTPGGRPSPNSNVNKTFYPIEKLHNWDKNPRAVKKEDFQRLKNQIQELGQYKPLLITPEGEVLGGNMRLRAYQEMGIKEVWVSIINPKNEAEKIKYALSDNDRIGYYQQQELAELIQQNGIDINLEDYKVDLGNPITLTELLDEYRPDGTDPTEKSNEITKVKCPKCGEEFEIEE